MNCAAPACLRAFVFCLVTLSTLASFAVSPVLKVDFQQGRYFDEPLFSFTYGGRSSAELLPKWKVERSSRKLDALRNERRIVWTDPSTGLQVRCVGVEYGDFQAVEWTLYFKNTGTENTPIIQDVEAIDLSFQRTQGGEFVLHSTKGDWCTPDSFEPFEVVLEPKSTRRFVPFGGRPTNAGLF